MYRYVMYYVFIRVYKCVLQFLYVGDMEEIVQRNVGGGDQMVVQFITQRRILADLMLRSILCLAASLYLFT